MWDELMEKIVHLLKCENEAEEAGHLGYAAMIRLEREKTVRSWDELLSHLKGW